MRLFALRPPAQVLAWGCLSLFCLSALSCLNRGASVTLAGSTAFQPYAEKLADEYDLAHPDQNVTVQGGGSALGISAALNGAAQIGMADLVEIPSEAASLRAVVVARDGIAIIVNPVSKVSGLSLAQLRSIYEGEIHDWKELGGAPGPITIVSRESGSGTRSSFESILGGFNLSQNAIIQDSNGTIRETVANDPQAIGYISSSLVNSRIKALLVDGVECRGDLILAGHYKLVRPIYFLTEGLPQDATKGFIDYVLGPEGQASIMAAGLLAAPAATDKP